MLLIAAGTRGLVPMRALMNWTPIQAHATKHKTACLYVTRWGREGVVRQERVEGVEGADQRVRTRGCR